jgi:hypothetical protein
MTKKSRRGLLLVLIAGMFAAISVLLASGASAQDVACPAGARGGAGGNAGRTVGGNGGLAFTVGGLGTAGSATAAGGNAGSARGGTGGRGGSGTLPVCNQNTNGGGGARTSSGGGGGSAPAYGTGGGSGPSYGVGGGLARTGAHTSAEIGLAGLAFVLGGLFLFVGQPTLKRIRA